MLKILIVLLSVAPYAMGTEPVSDQNTVNFMLAKSGSTRLGVCTSFFAQFKDKLTHITAAHCFDRYKSFTVFTAANGVTLRKKSEEYLIVGELVISLPWANGSISSNIKSYNIRTQIGEDELTFSNQNDIAYQELGFFRSSYASDMNVLNVANTFPQVGDELSLIGFSGGKGPFKSRCTFEGISLTSFSYNKTDSPQVSLICRSISGAKNILSEGASGGPVINSQGEAVGVLTGSSYDEGTLYHISPLIEVSPNEVDRQPHKLLLGNSSLFELLASKILYEGNKPLRACFKIQSIASDRQIFYLGVNERGKFGFQKDLHFDIAECLSQ